MSFPEELAETATRSLTRLGVTLRCGAMVRDINKASQLQVRDGPPLLILVALRFTG